MGICGSRRSDLSNQKPAESDSNDYSNLEGFEFISSSESFQDQQIKLKGRILHNLSESKRKHIEPLEQEILLYLEEGKLGYQGAEKLSTLNKSGQIETLKSKAAYEDAMNQFSEAIKLAKQMFLYGKENGNKLVRHRSRIYQGRALGCIALVNEKKKQYIKSIRLCESALKNFKKLKTYDDIYYKVFVLDTMWRCYWKVGKLKLAVKYISICIRVMKKSFPGEFGMKIRDSKKVLLAMTQSMEASYNNSDTRTSRNGGIADSQSTATTSDRSQLISQVSSRGNSSVLIGTSTTDNTSSGEYYTTTTRTTSDVSGSDIERRTLSDISTDINKERSSKVEHVVHSPPAIVEIDDERTGEEELDEFDETDVDDEEKIDV